MSDILIRDLSEDIIFKIDELAKRAEQKRLFKKTIRTNVITRRVKKN